MLFEDFGYKSTENKHWIGIVIYGEEVPSYNTHWFMHDRQLVVMCEPPKDKQIILSRNEHYVSVLIYLVINKNIYHKVMLPFN